MYNNVFIADDEVYICEFLKKILKRRGYAVTIASEGEEAKDILKHRTFDLIFIDHEIPGTTDFELIKVARQMNPEAKIIGFTGHSTVDGRIADDVGANLFLQKPLTLRKIEDILGGIE